MLRLYVFPGCVWYLFAIVPHALLHGKRVVDSMIVSDHLDFVSWFLVIMFVIVFFNILDTLGYNPFLLHLFNYLTSHRSWAPPTHNFLLTCNNLHVS